MNKYLDTCGYETPQQLARNRENGWDDEDSRAVFVVANTEDEALSWGREVSVAFVVELFQSSSMRWKSMNYAHGIESEPAAWASSDESQSIPVVVVGQWPVW